MDVNVGRNFKSCVIGHKACVAVINFFFCWFIYQCLVALYALTFGCKNCVYIQQGTTVIQLTNLMLQLLYGGQM